MGVHWHQLVATISPIDVAATNVLEPCAPASFEHDAERREWTDIDGSISSTKVVILTSHTQHLPSPPPSHFRPARTFQQQKQSWSAAIVPPSSPEEVNLRQVVLPLRLRPAPTATGASLPRQITLTFASSTSHILKMRRTRRLGGMFAVM